jgi:hypothetical protein
MWIDDIVPLWLAIEEIYFFSFLRLHRLQVLRTEFQQETADELMFSALFMVVGLADDALGDVGGEHILQSHLHIHPFLPEGVETASNSS